MITNSASSFITNTIQWWIAVMRSDSQDKYLTLLRDAHHTNARSLADDALCLSCMILPNE